jgi:hypothetical protein
MPRLERDTPPRSKWLWITLLLALFVVVVVWYAKSLYNDDPGVTPTGPAASASAVPLTLPTTTQ